MMFPCLTVFIVFIIYVTIRLNHATKITNEGKLAYLEREDLANSTQRKDIEHLDYIEIPFDTLPLEVAGENPVIQECIRELKLLSEDRILNLTGISNTDLKLQYGAPNLTYLSAYDQNFTRLARCLCTWGKELTALSHLPEAATVLEFGIACRSDIKENYTLLAEIYQQLGMDFKISALEESATQLNSLSKTPILHALAAFTSSEYDHALQ